jgi:hypothetical protein
MRRGVRAAGADKARERGAAAKLGDGAASRGKLAVAVAVAVAGWQWQWLGGSGSDGPMWQCVYIYTDIKTGGMADIEPSIGMRGEEMNAVCVGRSQFVSVWQCVCVWQWVGGSGLGGSG